MFPLPCEVENGKAGLDVTLDLLCLLLVFAAPVPKSKLIPYPRHVAVSPSVHRHDTSVSATRRKLQVSGTHQTSAQRMWLLIHSDLLGRSESGLHCRENNKMFNSGNEAEVQRNAEQSRGQKGRQGSSISRQFPKINRQMTWSKYWAELKKLWRNTRKKA